MGFYINNSKITWLWIFTCFFSSLSCNLSSSVEWILVKNGRCNLVISIRLVFLFRFVFVVVVLITKYWVIIKSFNGKSIRKPLWIFGCKSYLKHCIEEVGILQLDENYFLVFNWWNMLQNTQVNMISLCVKKILSNEDYFFRNFIKWRLFF